MTRDAHSRSSGDSPEPLYDENIPTPTHAERARTLVAGIGTATLCTVALDPAGYPYGSFVTLALDSGQPVFLISALAEHTKNLIRDNRASVLIAENVAADPLSNGRVTLVGTCARLREQDGTARSAFLETHPNAGYYADFKDFSFWKMDLQSVRYIGGYGRMSWVASEDWLASEPDPLVADAAGIIDHMNQDHADAVVSYCHAFSRATDISEARMTGIDRYGFEISAITAEGPRPVRVAFPEAVSTSGEARKALIELLEQARELSRLTP